MTLFARKPSGFIRPIDWTDLNPAFLRMVKDGKGPDAIAVELGVSKPALYRHARDCGIPLGRRPTASVPASRVGV